LDSLITPISQKRKLARQQWLTPIILDTQKAEISKVGIRSQPGQIVQRPYLENTHYKKRTGGVAQGIGPEFKAQYCKKKKKRKLRLAEIPWLISVGVGI
jgi:hypothetical protein